MRGLLWNNYEEEVGPQLFLCDVILCSTQEILGFPSPPPTPTPPPLSHSILRLSEETCGALCCAYLYSASERGIWSFVSWVSSASFLFTFATMIAQEPHVET